MNGNVANVDSNEERERAFATPANSRIDPTTIEAANATMKLSSNV
jgi:hypothetical protein